MTRTLRIEIWLMALLLQAIAPALAQQMSVKAPRQVFEGENFRVAYTVDSKEVENFRADAFPDGLEVVAGPYVSSQISYQIDGNHASSSSSATFTFTVFADKEGSYSIPAAHATVNGKRVSSHPTKLHVAKQTARTHSGAPRMHGDSDYAPGMRDAGSAITGNDLFIKVSANKRRVHEQEPVLLTYKVYTQVELTQLEGKMPDLKGFHTQEVKLPNQKSFHTEMVNGRPYRCVTWSQYVMYPQMTGELEIPSIVFKGIVVQQNRNVDPLEAFFNGGSGYIEVNKNITAPGISIKVDPLPKRPADFSGGVGRFNISATLDNKEVKAGDPINIRVVVGGIGNLKLLKQPIIELPKDFDKYDAKVTDKTKLTANGVEGNMIYDFLAVPRNQGEYTIPPISFTYYDTAENAYRTIKTQSFTLKVAKGDDDSSGSENQIAAEQKDIRPIKQDTVELMKDEDFFYGSVNYWICLLVPLVTFCALLVIFRRRAIENADLVKARSNRAKKMATKRLRKADLLRKQGHQAAFYDEVLRALWDYVSNKLNMRVEQLSRENIQERLSERMVDEGTIGKFTSALDECEFERYAPGDPKGNMDKTFESAMTAIMDIEQAIKASRKNRKTKSFRLILLSLLAMLALSANAVTKENGDREYQKGNYQQAIKDYQEVLKEGVSAEVYYNLGNAYFRSDNLTQAILAYERARILSPGDDDINFNLEFARSKTIDKIPVNDEMFYVTGYRSLVNLMGVDSWASLGVAAVVVMLLLVLLYLFSSSVIMRKVGFFGGIFFLFLFILSTFFAYQQKLAIERKCGAIVISPTVNVKKTPSKTSGDVFVIHEGTRVDITDKTIHPWRGIKLSDGRTGWVLASQIEEI